MEINFYAQQKSAIFLQEKNGTFGLSPTLIPKINQS